MRMTPVLFLTTLSLCTLTACASRTPPPAPDNRLAQTEHKIDQLSQQVALLQVLVDSHHKALHDLKGLPETASVPAASPPPVAPSKTAPVPVAPAKTPVTPPAATIESPAPQEKAVVSSQPDPMYQKAMSELLAGKYAAAGALFDDVVTNFPKDPLANNALYWAGECQYTQKKYPEALDRFKRLVAEYPEGAKVPDALLKIGFTYFAMGDTAGGTEYLKKVLSLYPFTPAGAKAEERLKTVRK